MSLAGQGGKGVLEKRVDGVVFLAEDVRVVRVGGNPLEAEEQNVAQGLNIGIFHRVALEPHGRGLGEKSFAGGRILEVGREFGEIGLPALGGDFALERFPVRDRLGDGVHEELFIEVHVRERREKRFTGKHVCFLIIYTNPAAFDRDQGKPWRAKTSSPAGRHLGLLSTYSDLGASFAFCRLFALVTKHSFLLV